MLTAREACTAYSRYILDIGQSQDWMALQVALAPCLLGYGIIARQLHDHHETKREGENPYWTWIANYVAEDYVMAVKTGSGRNPSQGDHTHDADKVSSQNSWRSTLCYNRRLG